MLVPNQSVLETNHPSTGPPRREMSLTGPAGSTTFQPQNDQQLASKQPLKETCLVNSHDIAVHKTDPQVLKTGTFPPRAGLLRYNTGYSGSSSLPKLKLNNFDGNPLEWPEWSSMFIATVDQRPIPDSEKMSHLKTLLTGKARSAISGMGFSGQFYGAAWSILERKFGRPHVIIDAQLEILRKASQVNPHDSTGLISFSVIVSNFVNVLKEYKRIGDLQSSSTLYMAIDKLPQVLKEKWCFYVDDKDDDWPDLIMFEKWLSRIAFVHEGFSRRESEEKKTEEAQIETNGSRKRRTSVQVPM